MQPENELIPQLFRKEFSKMVAVLSKLFGLQHMETAEDIVSETFLLATGTWPLKGIPENPTAWLYTVAKNKTLEYLRRNKLFSEKILPELQSAEAYQQLTDMDFSAGNIQDSQLQMLFAVCNPVIASEAQIGLALRVLCGFSIEEIAEAFLSNKETINKRLFRAREKLRKEKVKLNLPSDKEINERLDNVLHIIYLLFNEGYYSTTKNKTLHKDLCIEALRLGVMLTAFPATDQPKTHALIALMCYHSSRFSAREEHDHSPVLYDQQDKDMWDKDLIMQGEYFLNISARGEEMSSYHLEAAIAHWHCQKEDSPEKWEKILQLYNQLLQINYSPVVALNRTFALYKVKGPQEALTEAEKLHLDSNHFYFTLLGELYTTIDTHKAKLHFQKAYDLARTAAERQIIQAKIDKSGES